MKYLISHRGNIYGPKPELENNPDYIMQALKNGFDVEIDVWFVNNELWIGHDKPKYKCINNLIGNNKVWFHAKNLEAIKFLLENDNNKVFWHCKDKFAIVHNTKLIWTLPGEKLTDISICVLPEISILEPSDIQHCAGVCSDYIYNYG